MATHYTAQALVLRAEDRAEADRILSVFTKEFGRLEITAKAIRKMASKLRGGMEVFSVSDIEFVQGKNKYILTDAVFSEVFKNIKKNPEALATAAQISAVADTFIKGQEQDEHIFVLLREAFEKLDNYSLLTTNYSLVFQYFFWNFMTALGYAPQLTACAACAKSLQPEQLYFSPADGGALCATCYGAKKRGKKISQENVKVLRIILKKDWEVFIKLKNLEGITRSLLPISRQYYQYFADVKKNIHA